jgi:hypothetical protein
MWAHQEDEQKHLSDKGKRFTQCRCPRCTAYHNVYMLWTGQGMPRKYCVSCRLLVSRYDDAAMFEASINTPSHLKKQSKRPESE